MAGDHLGLTRRELDREIRWRLRKAPAEPDALLPFIGDLIASTVEANNAAIAKHLADGDDTVSTDEY